MLTERNLLYLHPDEIKRRQTLLFKRQIRNCYDNIPFYQKWFKKNGLSPADFQEISDIRKMPLLSKDDIRKDYEAFLNPGYRRERCRRSLSSGSTGKPFSVFFDRRSWIRKKYVAKLRARFQCGMKMGQKVAIFECDRLGKINQKNREAALLLPVLRARFFSLFEDLDKTTLDLRRFSPHNFYGYPSYLLKLARHVRKKGVSFPKLERVFTSSEYLDPNARRFMAEVFQAPLYDHYGCTEVKEVAWQCERQEGYHINEDEVLCEFLLDGKPAADGETGDIVLTDLRNRVMPLVRYRVGDLGMRLAGPCGCGRGFSLMRPCAGRASEYLTLPDGRELSPYRLTTAIEKTPGLLQYQITQIARESLLVRVILDGSPDKKKEAIRRALSAATRGLFEVNIESCGQIPVEKNGKFKLIRNNTTSSYGEIGGCNGP